MTNLKTRRIEAGLSQSQLAAEVPELKLRTLQRYEQGVLDINKAAADIVLKLARALECKPEEILERKI